MFAAVRASPLLYAELQESGYQASMIHLSCFTVRVSFAEYPRAVFSFERDEWASSALFVMAAESRKPATKHYENMFGCRRHRYESESGWVPRLYCTSNQPNVKPT